jgi:serine/threonine-protein phosphatase PP1-1
MIMAANIPRPGPANLGPNAGIDEWLEEAKQCHYLPERAMKELCEKVKEILMEGERRPQAASLLPSR